MLIFIYKFKDYVSYFILYRYIFTVYFTLLTFKILITFSVFQKATKLPTKLPLWKKKIKKKIWFCDSHEIILRNKIQLNFRKKMTEMTNLKTFVLLVTTKKLAGQPQVKLGLFICQTLVPLNWGEEGGGNLCKEQRLQYTPVCNLQTMKT